jgi:hypothetical protein
MKVLVEQRDALMRIPVDFDQRVAELASENHQEGDFYHRGTTQYSGNYTFRMFRGYHSGVRLLSHLQDCMLTCAVIGRVCEDVFGPEIESLQQKLRSLSVRLRPFQDMAYYAADMTNPYLTRVLREPCPGLTSSGDTSSCLDYLNAVGRKFAQNPTPKLLVQATKGKSVVCFLLYVNCIFMVILLIYFLLFSPLALERREPVPGALENITKLSHSSNVPSCFWPNCPALRRYSDDVLNRLTDQQMFYNLTVREVTVLENECLSCWRGCVLICRTGTYGENTFFFFFFFPSFPPHTSFPLPYRDIP